VPSHTCRVAWGGEPPLHWGLWPAHGSSGICNRCCDCSVWRSVLIGVVSVVELRSNLYVLDNESW